MSRSDIWNAEAIALEEKVNATLANYPLDTITQNEKLPTHPQITPLQQYWLSKLTRNPRVVTLCFYNGYYLTFAGDAFKLAVILDFPVVVEGGVLKAYITTQKLERLKGYAFSKGITFAQFN